MKTIQVNGPFATQFSFARVNRGFAKALSEIQQEYKVSVYGDKDKIDKYPEDKDLKELPELNTLWDREGKEADVIIYNNFPKGGFVKHGFKEFNSKIKIAYLAWEESVYPEIWVKEMNEHLHGLMVTSSFVEDIMRKAGVKIPIKVVHCGIDEDFFARLKNSDQSKYPLKTKKEFKFLHISTGRARKGVDVLIKSYLETFTKNDDVCLVIKSFHNPNNIVDSLLNKLRNENSPEVEHIPLDLSNEDLFRLHNSVDAEVYPTRAEGFGLPIAEAMLLKKPLIATNYSAYLDFSNEENSFLIDYKLVDALDSESVLINSKWAEPDQKDLGEKMRYIFENVESPEVKGKIEKAYESASKLTWENSAKTGLEFVKEIEAIYDLKNRKAGVISFFNNKDGLAEYTKHLFSNIEASFKEFYYLSNSDIADRVEDDTENVKRIWKSGETEFKDLIKFVQDNKLDIIHIQYHSGVNFPPSGLNSLVKKLKGLNVKTFLTLHAVKGGSFDITRELSEINLFDKVLVHNTEDYKLLEKKTSNLYLFNLPKVKFKKRSKSKIRKNLKIAEDDFVVITHGYMNNQKTKLPAVIEAINLLKDKIPNLKYIALNAVSSSNLGSSAEYKNCLELVKQYKLEDRVSFIPDFLDEQVVEIILQAGDINVLAYKDVGESASAAVNKCLASLNPTIVSQIKMFSDFDKEVYKVEEAEANFIADGILKLYNDKNLREDIVKHASKFIEDNNYSKKAVEILKIYKFSNDQITK